jgi:peptidoglycan-N-acetylglucosamine deacetylase
MIMKRLIFAILACVCMAAPAAAQTRSVAVTFDDLPWQGPSVDLCDPAAAMALTRDFVGMLEPLDANATAFINEEKVCDARRATLLPQILSVWLDAGVELGNHTYSHPSILNMTAEAWLEDVDRGEIITRPLLARRGKTLRYFRHPYLFTGETPEKKAAMAQGLKDRGYIVAPVTIDNSDWIYAALYRKAEKDGDTAAMQTLGEAYVDYMQAVFTHYEPYSAEVAGGREPAQILLLHANSLNRDWYPKIHAMLLARGYRFIPLEEALKDPIYARPENWLRRNGVSWLHRWNDAAGRKVRWEPDPPEWVMKAYQALN